MPNAAGQRCALSHGLSAGQSAHQGAIVRAHHHRQGLCSPILDRSCGILGLGLDVLLGLGPMFFEDRCHCPQAALEQTDDRPQHSGAEEKDLLDWVCLCLCHLGTWAAAEIAGMRAPGLESCLSSAMNLDG